MRALVYNCHHWYIYLCVRVNGWIIVSMSLSIINSQIYFWFKVKGHVKTFSLPVSHQFFLGLNIVIHIYIVIYKYTVYNTIMMEFRKKNQMTYTNLFPLANLTDISS